VRVLVTGAGGQLGRELVDAFSAGPGDHEVAAFDHARLDVADRDAVLVAVTATHPDVIVHSAAWTAVDACEDDPSRAFAVNALGTRHVAEAARRIGARVCYVSTDYVFDGTKETPYVEWDATNPQSVYGRSKLAGEHELDPGSTVVRTSWVCGRHGGNMVKTVLRLAAEDPGRELAFVYDQRGCPSFADDLASMIHRLVLEGRPGTFHVTNQGPVSWYEFVRAILVAAGFEPRVKPIAPAPRPANSVLDNAALRLSGIPLLPDFHEPLERLVKELLAS
jgi:dTDP-4-dehydrorhamnose reductase